MLGSVVIAAVLYLLSAYAQLVGFGDPAKITASAAPLNDLADSAGVHLLGYLIDIGAAASFFACVTGSVNAASRLLYSMGGVPVAPPLDGERPPPAADPAPGHRHP